MRKQPRKCPPALAPARRALPRELLRTDLFATLAHEIAHQWWGNRVGWRSGRDQWLSEALAEFVEERFLRDVLEIDARDLAERAEWAKRGYESATGLDRPPHAYGPPVLGVRLDSTLSADAYRGVVYDKGSTVFTMVADRLGEEPFVEMLGALAEAVDHRTIDTPTFFRAIEKMSGIDLDPIVLPFVYDINFPRVLYSHRVETNEDGAWLVRGVLEQFPSFHRKSRVTRRGEGAWDVVNEYRIHGAPRGVSIGVPFEVAYGSSQRSNELVRGVGGTISMRPGATPFAVRLDEEPTGFWLDQRGRTFARYLCGTCDARLATIARIDALIALDRRAEAVALVRAAIEDGHGDRVKQTRRFERSPFGVALHTRMAMLLLDDDEDAAALRELETAEEGYRKREPGVIEMGGGVERRWLQVVEFHRGVFGEASLKRGLLALRARIDLRAGRTDAAWDRLSRWLYLDIPQREGESTGDSYARNSMSTNSIDGDGQAYALLAIAACTSGRTSACLAATREARRREADLSALQVAATP